MQSYCDIFFLSERGTDNKSTFTKVIEILSRNRLYIFSSSNSSFNSQFSCELYNAVLQ